MSGAGTSKRTCQSQLSFDLREVVGGQVRSVVLPPASLVGSASLVYLPPPQHLSLRLLVN